MPFLMRSTNGDIYFRLENCCGVVSLAGFTEAIESFTGKTLSQPESEKFIEEFLQNTRNCITKVGRKHGKRMFAAILQSPEASTRLAHLDIEKYGIAKVNYSGNREQPFYTTTRHIPLQIGNFASVPSEQLDLQKRLKSICLGGNLAIIELDETETKPEDIAKLTLNLLGNHGFDFFTYNRSFTYCSKCQKSWSGNLHKCPSCGSMGTLVEFNRFNRT
jgi:anaerobic ribonucleoside-triphosphate reductase